MAGRFRRTLLLACAAAGIWSLGYGPLLPWSPIRPGFATLQGRRVTLIYPEGYALPTGLRQPDDLLGEAESFHRLTATRPIKILLCPDWPAAYRILPRLARRGIGAITLATGTAIYLLPTIAERQLNPVEFVRHELSHAVLHQNQSLWGATRLTEAPWLAEGVAVWFGRQTAYGSEEDYWRAVPGRDLRAYIDPALREGLAEPFDVRFGYLCWRRFNQFLAGSYEGPYWNYVHAVIANAGEWRALFATHFPLSFAEAVSAFVEQERRVAETGRRAPDASASERHIPRSQSPPQSPR